MDTKLKLMSMIHFNIFPTLFESNNLVFGLIQTF